MNSFQHPLNEVNFGSYRPDDVKEALSAATQDAKHKLKQVLAINDQERTFENTVLGISSCTDHLDRIANLVSTHDSLLGGEWSKPNMTVAKQYSAFYAELSANKDIYLALKCVQSNENNLQPHQTRLLRDTIEEYERQGINLPKNKRDRLQQVKQQLAELSTKFAQNVIKQDDKAGLHITKKAWLNGLDQEFIADCQKQARAKKLDGWWVRYSQPNTVKFMTQASCHAARNAMNEALRTKNNQVNEPIIQKILSLRKEMATTLGFKDYADLNTNDKMAKTGQAAHDFIANLQNLYSAPAAEEFAQMQKFARDHEDNPELELPLYEISSGLDLYYANLYKKQFFDLDTASLNSYFEANAVLAGMFEVLSELYSIRFTPNTTQPIWHKDVTCFDIIDSDNNHIATVWCDWYERPGKKDGAWMNQFYVAPRHRGSQHNTPHLGYVAANLPTASDSLPSLLTIRDVETIWHEFGHFMHLAFSTTELKEQSMMHTAWDFVEAPSQIMENFVWEPQVLAKFAKHYKTGKPLPKKTLDKLVKMRKYRAASKSMRQLMLADADLELHRNYDPKVDGSAAEFVRKVYNRSSCKTIEKPAEGIHSFSHIFAGGYGAGYYSYKWAESIEADLYSRFAKEGPINPKTGKDYKKTILSQGDQHDPHELIKNFLGRDYSQAAMFERDGLKQ